MQRTHTTHHTPHTLQHLPPQNTRPHTAKSYLSALLYWSTDMETTTNIQSRPTLGQTRAGRLSVSVTIDKPITIPCWPASEIRNKIDYSSRTNAKLTSVQKNIALQNTLLNRVCTKPSQHPLLYVLPDAFTPQTTIRVRGWRGLHNYLLPIWCAHHLPTLQTSFLPKRAKFKTRGKGKLSKRETATP